MARLDEEAGRVDEVPGRMDQVPGRVNGVIFPHGCNRCHGTA